MVGKHTIEIVIGGDRLNVTPDFYTYDASKIRVGEMPPGYTGMPVDFQGKKYLLTFDSFTGRPTLYCKRTFRCSATRWDTLYYYIC